MITMISPAKNMKIKPEAVSTRPLSLPAYVSHTKIIAALLRTYSPWDYQQLMDINENLAADSADRIYTMKFDQNGTSAIETYDGIQYKYMNPCSFSEAGKSFAQDHIRILSGAYGILKPYDSIYEYRLEMQTKLMVDNCKSLYEFWSSAIFDELTKEHRTVVNLTSKEYEKCVKKYLTPQYRYITCYFKVLHKGSYKVQATAAKMARGRMVRYIAENQIDTPEELKNFSEDGYFFEESLSTPSDYIYLQQ